VRDIHDDLAKRGFTNGELYDSARPNYAPEAIDYIVNTLDLDTHSRVLDLGAGTGIFARQIAARVARVTAVEPSAPMRAALSARSPSIDVLEGRDVSIPLKDASVDAVVVAQAFHWFDAPRALVEIHRVLAEGGGLALVWNSRDETLDWVRRLGEVVERVRPASLEGEHDVGALRDSGLFFEVEHARFSHVQSLTPEDLARLVQSRSYVAVLNDLEREELLEDVARVIAPLGESLLLPYVSDVYCAKARPLT
jgi:SAM-dependent methyltransferase